MSNLVHAMPALIMHLLMTKYNVTQVELIASGSVVGGNYFMYYLTSPVEKEWAITVLVKEDLTFFDIYRKVSRAENISALKPLATWKLSATFEKV